MPGRDPFPMASMEAKALEASVRKNTDNKGKPDGRSRAEANATSSATSWSTMPLDSGIGDVPSSTDIRGDEMDDKSELVARKRSIRKDEEEDIYTHVDKEVIDEEDEEKLSDPVLDVPLEELRGDWRKRYKGQAKRSFFRFYRRLYGDKLPLSEMMRTLCLAMTLFFMIGGYWMLRSLKDSVLMALCGYQAIPKAKMLSVFVVLGVVSVYNHLLDSDIAKHQLFYVFGTFYFFLFTVIAFMLMNPTVGLANKYQDEGRLLGWVSYCAIESFGSVMVSLFWSFANSNISLETAKSSYGVMVAFAQLGSILGPAVVTRFAEEWGIAQCYLLGALNMLLLQGTMYFYIRTYGSNETRAREEAAGDGAGEESDSPKKKKERAGILEGLMLFWKFNYVKGIFAISCLFMVEVTIVDFTLKVLAKEYFSEEYPCEISNLDCYNAETKVFGLTEEASNAIASFMGLFGVATNSLSFIFSLLGTSAIIRKFGLRLTLLLFPCLCLLVIIVVRLRPTLYIVFLAMIVLKANSYALNNPTKEMLYQPTSSAVRYKAKSWIDIFGARGSKALGSVVTNAFSDSAVNLVANGSLVGIAVSCFLIWNARFMGKMFEQYTESGYVVGEEVNPESTNIQMAMAQNEREDTSCALDGEEEDEDEEETPIKKAEIAMV
uniref:ADP,ATP carrier protein n=1 Tax=Pseudo-nitzschia australis TaxID=44445 RepID=A0A6V0BS57_9STRA|mmetsp:Transcript_8770/g.18939  ORF Transcript_8770/g.18939 Transcript_8770/m.18939 type:complete len:661 (-) Transcript_8770:2376-4358(-)|eukprot:CAMPEP_0168204418 /NCGR_PEP_ID=MMETSP0139_2-20121125/25383_1 /TAXON_ID=44445 /ORGANISM="Pseudo-nitzschia australis, Strain 10249 10 AB" /LENGTH=660 /DNA_ID=CAMNT_0008130347 /DNA_START=222 /DNA_END=2204 /DNA_ORIENTATION=+